MRQLIQRPSDFESLKCDGRTRTHNYNAPKRASRRTRPLVSPVRSLIFLMMFLIPISGYATSIVYSDDTFDLANYTTQIFQTGGATITTIQTATEGNPGFALKTIVDVPASPRPFYATEYFFNSSFVYDPATQGPIASIDFVEDFYFSVEPGTVTSLGSNAILLQDGKYFRHRTPLPLVEGVWQTGTATGLTATDFALVTDLLTLTTDANVHPDFSGGPIQLGIWQAVTSFNPPARTFDSRKDNVVYTVNQQSVSVPVPAVVWLMLAGLSVLAARQKR